MRKMSYIFVLGALLVLSGSAAKADVVPNDDPRIGGGGTGSCAAGSVDLMSATQSFSIPAADLYPPTGPCIVDFTNETGGTLTFVTVAVGTAFAGTLTCGLDAGSPFTSFLEPPATAPNTCTFLGASIPDEGAFGLTFGSTFHPFCAPGSTVTNGVCSNPLRSLDGTASTTPEPASMVLIGTGLAALVTRRKKLRSIPRAS
jgi:hypothetical protein